MSPAQCEGKDFKCPFFCRKIIQLIHWLEKHVRGLLKPISLGSFICYPFCYGNTPQIDLPKKDNLVPFLDELLSRQQGSRLFINRILRLYEENVIFMIKPDQKRYWLRSIALRDADETFWVRDTEGREYC
ncbi:MAG: hypothetical protein D3923_06180 [Candidatus Electrothrix sp. AR3]|nr:hypothetical protein [Candidatus Electrothrix sp. AR3]